MDAPREPDDPARLALDGWYADPLDAGAARARLEEAARTAQAAYRRGERCFACLLRQMTARFWLGRPVTADYESLRAAAADARERALVELVYGQLLASRRLAGAAAHLEAGFEAGRDLLSAREFFTLMKRHRLLAEIPAHDTPARPETLAALLTEARVIRRLRGTRRTRPAYRHDRRDTVG
jgi:hypothetical protein